MSLILTPDFVISDTYVPIIPSTISTFYPVGATVILPGSVPIPPHLDLNNNKNIRKEISRNIKYKILDLWLFDELAPLLGYLKVDANGDVSFISSLNEYNNNAAETDSVEIIEKKADFLEKNLVTTMFVYELLKKFVKGTGSEWIKLHKIDVLVSEFVKEHIERAIRNIVTKTNN